MNRLCLPLFLCGVMSFLFPSSTLAGPITVPAGLAAGDQYRLVFVTSTSTNVLSTNIGDYNAFVSGVANSDPVLASLATTWTAIASTVTESAIDNTKTNPAVAGVPIYNLGGQLLATSNADFWDGTIANPVLYDEHGVASLPGYTEAWTGTGTTGIPDGPEDPLGTTLPAWGDATLANGGWIYAGQGQYVDTELHTMFAISGVLTVVPEPSTLLLAAMAAMALWACRGKRALS
jgi:hypothetical protein